MGEEKAEYHPVWQYDCCGKWDYDCNLVFLSSRYWPGVGGGTPSAVASILIGDPKNGPYEHMIREEFTGETEKEVMGRVEAAIRREFAKTTD